MPSKREIIKYLEHFKNRARKPEGLFACVNCPLFSGNFIPDFLNMIKKMLLILMI
jgi:hypothetical protein